MLIESIIRTTLASAQSEKEVLTSFVNNFLVQNFMLNRLYREHQLKNFDDKIFFYEPPNKYCDLLWLQHLVFELLSQPGTRELVDQTKIQAYLEEHHTPSDTSKEELPSHEKLELAEPPLAFEAKAQQYMLELLTDLSAPSPKLWSTNKFLECLKA